MTQTKPEADAPKPLAPATSEDVVIVGGRSADGSGTNVLRLREGRVEAGQLRQLEQGKPIVGEVVSLTPRAEQPNVCDVKVEYAPPVAASESRKGPAQVATASYRDNWDAIWKRSDDKPLPS
ncbi:MAG: hypothetical protein R3B13_12015 [Polyangiaceae bacterium]